jgi:hypothetical protein
MATLVLCYGLVMGQCGTQGEFQFASLEKCQQERKYIVANRSQHFVFAVCRDGGPTPKEQ